MKKFIFLFTLLILGILILVKPILAVCPVCTITVSTGVGLCRWLGIDDSITGVWLGGLIVSLIIWTINWLEKKQIHFKGKRILTVILFYFIVIAPLYWFDIIGHSLNKFKFLGADKLLTGIIAGGLVFLLAVWLHNFLKKKNQGKSFFPFQKVVLPVLFLLFLSFIFYQIC